MLIRELINELQRLDPTARVFIEGYESGLNDVMSVEPITVRLDANDDEYGGKHTYYDEHEDGDAAHCNGFLLRS